MFEGFARLLPDAWLAGGVTSVWVSVFRLRRISSAHLVIPHVFDIRDVRIALMNGSLEYVDLSKVAIDISDASTWILRPSDQVVSRTEEATYSLFITPFEAGGKERHSGEIQRTVSMAVGLSVVVFGRNIAFQWMFDNTVTSAGRLSSVVSHVFENPIYFPIPDIVRNQDIVSSIATTLEKQPEAARNRISLSLQWFKEATYEKGGPNALLKYWIALETLAMPDTRDIRPIEDALREIYGMPHGEVRSRFAVGKLFGLRSRIVHNGELIYPHESVSAYIEALYIDMLLSQLRQVPQKRALAVLETPGLDLRSLLRF